MSCGVGAFFLCKNILGWLGLGGERLCWHGLWSGRMGGEDPKDGVYVYLWVKIQRLE